MQKANSVDKGEEEEERMLPLPQTMGNKMFRPKGARVDAGEL